MENKPPLPKGLHHETAITDYLREMGKIMKDAIKKSYQNIDFFKQVLIIMTVNLCFSFFFIFIFKRSNTNGKKKISLYRFQLNLIFKLLILCVNVCSKLKLLIKRRVKT